MSRPKNIAASVKARLQNKATERGEDFNLLLIRYGIERFLFRLSQSQHANRFLLKGAMLFVIWNEKIHRPTRDLDLLGFGPSDMNELEQTFREILTTEVVEDGLVFDVATVQAGAIREDNAYGGTRVRFWGKLGSAEVPVQVDVGVGDVVTPRAETTDFPALLDFPAPRVRAYPVYTVIAEKLEAMVKLGMANTRMKDFYDLWFLFRRFELDTTTLREAVVATFTRRQTELPKNPVALTETFANDASKQAQWAAFLRRNALQNVPKKLPDLVQQLRSHLSAIVVFEEAD